MKYNLFQQAFGFNEIKNIKEYQNYNLIKNKTDKEEILDLFNNEVLFDKEDEISAEKAIERLAVKKQDNFYDYYAWIIF